MNTILAIDPGAQGAIVIIQGSKVFECIKMPDTLKELATVMLDISRAYNVETAMLELVGGYAGEEHPGNHMFNFGENYGALQMALHLGEFPEPQLVRPQKWQQGVPGVKGLVNAKRKRALKEHAQKLFPDIKVTLWNADALLIGDYAQSLSKEGRPKERQALGFKPNHDAAAIEWAKGEGFSIPERGSKEWVQMLNYYIKNIAQ